mmetsp:Transcript_46872/g.91509  ORF Transcript_46872/g.91509 Transcript_46872/m.91509 type:complete len:123 (+) Transcript_46872:109-477(+)
MYGNNKAKGYRGTGATPPPSAIGDANRSIIERQNDARIDELSSHVSALKALTADIQGEVQSQNGMLDGMGDVFGTAKGALADTTGKISEMLAATGVQTKQAVVYIVCAVLFLSWLVSRGGGE